MADKHIPVILSNVGSIPADDLAHYGVKGMKWGVRNDKGHEGERVKTKKLDKLDKKWEKENTGTKGWVKAHNAMADRMNNGMIDKFNEDPRWKDIDLSTDSKLEAIYMEEFMALSDKVFREETLKLGSNPSGTKKFVMETDEDGDEYVILRDVREAQHAEDDVPSAFKITRNRLGHISSLESVENVLKHYGVKGMKWGVRRSEAQLASAREVTVTQKRPGTYAKATGGKKLPISDDAKAALEARQKARASTTDALSNKELQALVNRMNLEQQYSNLNFQSDRRSKGARFIAGLMGNKRYGKKRTFTDADEEMGEKVRQIVEDHLASKKQS